MKHKFVKKWIVKLFTNINFIHIKILTSINLEYVKLFPQYMPVKVLALSQSSN